MRLLSRPSDRRDENRKDATQFTRKGEWRRGKYKCVRHQQRRNKLYGHFPNNLQQTQKVENRG